MATLQDVSELLATTKAPGAFATRRTGAADDLRVRVKGIGRIVWPITRATARRLCAVARPARYGFRKETRLDDRIRDTWEIPKSRVTIDQRTWSHTLRPLLDQIRRNLGLPDGCRLSAELHNMLVYEPGQFFVTHQDSEKTDDMIGTFPYMLVLVKTDAVFEREATERRIWQNELIWLTKTAHAFGTGEAPHRAPTVGGL